MLVLVFKLAIRRHNSDPFSAIFSEIKNEGVIIASCLNFLISIRQDSRRQDREHKRLFRRISPDVAERIVTFSPITAGNR